MKINIKISGLGGQGINKLSDIIASSALRENPNLYVVVGQDYDSVVRGGISNGLLVISEEEILNPMPNSFHLVIDVNKSHIVWRKDFNKDERVVDLTESMSKIKSRQRGMFLLGVTTSLHITFLKKEAVESAIKDFFRRDDKVSEENIKIFQEGLNFIK